MDQLEGDLVFDRIFGVLRCPFLSKSWHARSGKQKVVQRPKDDLFHGMLTMRPPKGWGTRCVDPLPRGIYRTGIRQLNVATSPMYKKPGFTDQNGFYWFLHLIRWRGGVKGVREYRREFGIHPDGRPPGTQGCIGLTDADTEPIFGDIKKLIYLRNGTIWVEVA